MTLKLSDEQKQALAQQPHGQPLTVEDEDSHTQYVLVKKEVFERLQNALVYDGSEPDPREFASMMYETMKEAWDAPGMEVYDNYEPPTFGAQQEES